MSKKRRGPENTTNQKVTPYSAKLTYHLSSANFLLLAPSHYAPLSQFLVKIRYLSSSPRWDTHGLIGVELIFFRIKA